MTHIDTTGLNYTRSESADRTAVVRIANGQLVDIDVRWRDVLWARLRCGALDHRLANGAEPEHDRLLAVRAGSITRPSYRSALADHWQQLVVRAQGSVPWRELRVPIARSRILESKNDIERVAVLLRSRRPTSAAGVASATLLLTDGASPIYLEGGRTDLGSELSSALEKLEML